MTMEKHVVAQLKVAGSKAINENCYVTQTQATFLESLPYYYGCISREDAEWILYDEGCTDGLYLLRESGTDLVLSLCHHNSVLHYRINKLPNGDVVLQGLPNQTFASPMELIDTVDGLACKPTKPLKALFGKCLPPTHWGLSDQFIRSQLLSKAANYGMSHDDLANNLDCDLHFNANFSPFVQSLILKSLHELQPWYHYRLSRADAERRIESSGHADGKFLVRERDESSYAICLSHESRVKHYRIDILPSGNFAIQDGPKFESIIALVSHYTIFSGGLWCMLADGCPRPQEMIRQYAEQSSAQLSNLRESVSMNHHHHPHPHPHHLLATPSHGQLTCRFSANATAANATSGNGHRSRSIDRYQPKDSTKQCKQCLQAMLTVHAAAANRRRRVSTPTNLKLKEWFNTINHKWARIKRQVILHHQRQQPLINEDNYGTTSEISCCHVSSINGSQTKSNGERQRTFGDILLNYSNDQHNCCNWNGQLDRMVTGGVEANRYTNSYDTYGYCHRRQQFGRWHEEPAFGSRYAFDTENQDPNSSESLQKQSPLLSTQTLHRKLNHVQPTSASSTPNGRCSNKRTINGMLTNGHRDLVNGSNDHLIDVCPALIKSSSIDTITAILTDPIEEIRRLHLHQTHANVTMESANTIQTRNGNIITLDSIDTPPCMATIRTCHNGGKFHLQRTNSFDALNSNVPIDDAHHCNCNCGDWLLGLNLNDPNDPFGSLANGDDDIDLMINNSNINNNNENPNMVDGKTFEQLSDLFNTKQHQLLNGHLQCLSTERSTGFVLTDMNPIKPEMDNLNNGLSKTTTNGFNALNHLNGIRTNLLMNSLKPKSTTSTSSSVGGSSGDSGSGSSSSAEMNTSSSGKSVASSRCGMGTAFSSFGLRSFSQATTIDIQSELKSHQSNNTSTTTTTTTTAKMQSNTNETTNNCDHSTSQMENMNAPIIDLLKEFDVCFNGTEHIDDDSSTLTDISSHSLNSPLKRKCIAANGFVPINSYGNGTLTTLDGGVDPIGQQMWDPLPMTSTAGVINTTSSSSIATAASSLGPGKQVLSSNPATITFVPPPTIPPPPLPTSSINSLSSSSSASLQQPTTTTTMTTITKSSIVSLQCPSAVLANGNGTIFSSSSGNTPQQQVPSGLKDAIISGELNGHKTSTTTTTPANDIILSRINESNCHFNGIPSSSTSSVHQQHHQQQQSSLANETSTNMNNGSMTIDQMKDIELICLNDEPEEVQETIRKYRRGPICFDPRCITLKRRIGNGYFGDVFLATIPSASNATVINLAVKMLKSHAVPQQKAEILREAQTMAKLDHRHIVRLIGVCEGDPFMLVMELAPLGPLNKYLQNYGQNLSEDDILRLMLQVAKAMQYLEEMNCVHRDLAARNVLLVNEKFAKVSDFGMSRALGQGKDYYKARSASKWPLKWYAPECIYYYKFSSKSDVWSYGIALWEALSRGEMPYQGMDGQDILRMLSDNRRLPKPENCPVIIYQLMWSCWQFKPEDRLNFAAISDQLTHHLAGKQ